MKVEPFGLESGKEEKQGVRAQVVASASTHTQAEVPESWEGVRQAEVTARCTGMCALISLRTLRIASGGPGQPE